MLELIDELRELEFTVALMTGGGTEFVRAITQDLYGVPPELVVGTLIDYDFGRPADGSPGLTRTAQLQSPVNEDTAKISLNQGQLGRRPIMAAGNSGGDREMLEWASVGDGPNLALLIDHDDAEREFRYVSTALSSPRTSRSPTSATVSAGPSSAWPATGARSSSRSRV